jgi:hypothetical protein
MSYRCRICGETHDDLPDISSDRPDPWWGVPEGERDRRAKLTSDTCVIDDEDFFIRGVLELPIVGHPQAFGFGVWVSQKRENFDAYLNAFDSDEIGPFFGWLCTRLAYYPVETRLLKSRAVFRGRGQRPLIQLAPADHPLVADQRDGITLDHAWDIVHFYQKSSGPAGT